MKNLKKVLAMVLAFACTFSMFAGAKVFEDVPAGSDYSEAITMLSDLGVIQGKDDGKYHPEDTITRAEACAMIARLMTGDPNVSQYVGAQSFTDVAKGSWKDSAIGYCYINGIVIGVGNNKFEPDRAITDAEFVTMVVRAMGYETADMKQNYPFSYMSNAQAIGLLDGTNMVASTDALRGEDAQVIYNALFTDYARGAKLVNTTHGTSVESYPTLAESVWGLERAAVGTWSGKDDETATLTNCKAHTWVVVGADKDNEGYILAYPIDDDTTDVYETQKDDADGVSKKGYYAYSFKYDGDASAVAGYQVELWGEGQHGEPTWEKSGDKVVYSEDWTIKAIKTVKGQTAYDYNASMADSKSTNGTIELGETSLDLDSVATNASNVEMANTTETGIFTYLSDDKYNNVTLDKSDKKVEEALNVRDGAQYKLMDWDSDGDVDWVVIDEANYYKVEAVNSTRLTVSSMIAEDTEDTQKTSKNETWKLNDLNDKTDYKVKYEVPEDLEEGDIIEVTYSFAYDKSEKEEVVTATVTKVEAETAELDKVSTKDDLELTFNGEVLKIAQNKVLGDVVVPANPAKYEDFDDEELGTEFALWQNRNGFIVYSDYATETSNYMMILDTADGSDATGNRKEAKADILLADNSVKKDVEFASDLKIDGKTSGNGYEKSDRQWNESMVVGNVYKFWQDEDGVITKMESVFDVTADEQYTEYGYDKKADRLSNKGSQTNTVAALENAKVLFAVMANYMDADADSDKLGGQDVEVDDTKVLAVEQADIPNINNGGSNDTATAQMVSDTNTWLGINTNKYIAAVDKSGDATAAILGVANFNQFDAASTKVGLVTSVSYDKNDVVEIEVAYNGEKTTVKSAEKVDFEDIVEQYDGNKDNGLTTKKASELLKDNAAYAEITTNADGVLTDVTFMNVNGNTATGHYYEVNRDVVKAVKSGYITVGTDSYMFADDENLYSVGYLNTKSKDLASDVLYYTVDGTPTIHDTKSDEYTEELLQIANGFDGTPKITAESSSNLGTGSDVDDEFNDADTYVIADVASKIKGDVVAVYTFEDTLGEVDADANTKVVFEKTSYTVEVPKSGEQANTAVIKWSEVGNIDIKSAVVKGQSGSATGLNNVTLDTTNISKDNKATVSVPDNGDVGEFTVVLTDSNNKPYEVTVKVVNPQNKEMTFDTQDYELTALKYDGTGVVVGTVKGADGQKLSSVTATALSSDIDVEAASGVIKVKTRKVTKAGTYQIKLTADGYNDKIIDVTVGTKANPGTMTIADNGGNLKVTFDNLTDKRQVAAAELATDSFTVAVKTKGSVGEAKTVAVKDVLINEAEVTLVLDQALTAGEYTVTVNFAGTNSVLATTRTMDVTVA